MKKTTVELPEDLLIEAKQRAAELGRPLRALIEAGLRAELRTLAAGASDGGRAIVWVVAEGGLPTSFDVADRESFGEALMVDRMGAEP